MAENIVLSKSDILRVIDSINFDSEFPDPDPEDIAGSKPQRSHTNNAV